MDILGKLIKVSIEAYENEDFTKRAKATPNRISLPVNPESFTQNLRIKLNQQQGQGNEGTNPSYEGTEPEELKLDFILDGTNTIQGYNSSLKFKPDVASLSSETLVPVKDQLKIFMNMVYKMNCEIHRPHFLKINWGDGINFQGVLKNLDLNYTLFKPDGDPLRIKVSATFLKYLSQKERVARECKKSPDLTHVRIVKAGDRLDWMTYQIYNDPKYLIQIAKANKLTSFRKIKPGIALVFPPLEKTS